MFGGCLWQVCPFQKRNGEVGAEKAKGGDWDGLEGQEGEETASGMEK